MFFGGGEGFWVQGSHETKAKVMVQRGTLGSCRDVQFQFCPCECCGRVRGSGDAVIAWPVLLVCPDLLFSASGIFTGAFSGWGCAALALGTLSVLPLNSLGSQN